MKFSKIIQALDRHFLWESSAQIVKGWQRFINYLKQYLIMVDVGQLSCICHYQLCPDSLNCQKVFVFQNIISTVYLNWQMFVF